MRHCFLALLSLAVVGCLAISAWADEPSGLPDDPIDRALEVSKRTGRPVLAMVGSKTCAPCMALKERLSTDRTLQPLIAKYVPLYVAADNANTYTKWVGYGYQTEERAIPKLFIIRADGEQIYGKAGAPQGRQLNLLLLASLKQAGRQLSERQLVQLQENLEKAQAAYEAKDYEEAVNLLAQAAGSGSYARPAVEANEMVTKLTEEAKSMLEAAQQKIDSGSGALDGVIELVRIQDQFSKIPEIRTVAGKAVQELKRDSATRDLLQQAQLFRRAEDYLDRNRDELALNTYKKIVEEYPGSDAATLAEEKLNAAK